MKKKILVSIIGIALVVSIGFNIYQLNSLNTVNVQNQELQNTIAELQTSISNYEAVIADNEKSVLGLELAVKDLQSENELLSYVFTREDVDPDIHTTFDDSTFEVTIDQTMIDALSTCNKAFNTSSYEATLADAEFYMKLYHTGDLEKETWFEFCETGDIDLIFGGGGSEEDDTCTAMKDEWDSVYGNTDDLSTPVDPDVGTPTQEQASRPTPPTTPTTQPNQSPNEPITSVEQLPPEEKAAFYEAFANSGGGLDVSAVDNINIDPKAYDAVIQ